ncbi:methyltransferase domain-containing protein [Aliivibrio wodanis]|uniref:methyltransferase domain-containing protein n=1 Tax=Aliivibrio wodanis TaxID=80852 RepID=UPI00406CDEC0
MAQITNGTREVLNIPYVYNIMQNIMGANKFRVWFAEKYLNNNGEIKVLDIGCGTAEILNYLNSNIIYSGFDLSKEYIESARKKYGTRGDFECGLVTDKSFEDNESFDIILVLGVLHHLEDEEVLSLCLLATKHLKKGGKLITVDPCFIDNQNYLAKYLISKDRGQNVREQDGYLTLLNSSFSSIDSTIRNQRWVPYTHCINVCIK